MVVFFEFISSIFGPILLLIGSIFSFLLGTAAIRTINTVLYAFDTPCIEIITLIIALVSPIGYLYGAYHKKFFNKRTNEHNFLVFVISFVFGAIVTFFPISYTYTVDTATLYCPGQLTILDKIAQSVSTGTITAVIAFLSLDLGVIYANTIGASLKKLKKTKK